MYRTLIIFTSLILLAASCQKETCVDTPATLTYTIVPEVSFMVKSGEEAAVAVNPAVNILSYRVYHKKVDENGTPYYDYIKEMGAYVPIDNASDIRVPITLIKDQEYKLVFIAQHRFESQQRTTGYAYTITDDDSSSSPSCTMSVNTAASFTSGDQLEAFAFVDTVGPITGNENRKITLRRVVSQVNISTTAAEKPSKIDIAVSGTAASYNIFEETYSQATANPVLFNSLSCNGASLATVYVLPAGNSVGLDMTMYYGAGSDAVTKTLQVQNVSVAPNYKTNVTGNI